MTSEQDDLGFGYRIRKNGEVELLRHGRQVAVLRGPDADAFTARVESADPEAAQQLMARLTGNYKRGNERLAGGHRRNRD